MKEISSQAIHPSLRKLLSYATSERNIELEYRQYIQTSNRKLFVLEISGKLIGCLGIELISSDNCLIKHIAVSPTARGKGIGSKMIHFIRETYGLRFLSAETDVEAVDFYRNYGFRINSLGEKYPGIERFLCEFESN